FALARGSRWRIVMSSRSSSGTSTSYFVPFTVSSIAVTTSVPPPWMHAQDNLPLNSSLDYLSPSPELCETMPYVITEACISVKDRACVDVCPVDCIYEGAEPPIIHP